MLASVTVRTSLVFVVGLLLAAGPVFATPYETFIDVDDQADLEDLLAAGDISQDTFNELLDLLEVGVDLATADRARLYALPNLTYDEVDKLIAFRERQNGIVDPAALVAAGVLSEDKLLAIASFIVVRPPNQRIPVRGWVRAMTRYTVGDDVLPPFSLRGRFSIDKHWQAGFAATFSRLQIGNPVYDPNRGALIAERRGYRGHLPKIYAKYETEQASAIVGSFRVGFAQRLTFDNSQHYTPNGLYLDDQLYYSADLARECRESAGELATSPCAGAAYEYVTPDWNWRDGLFGAGAGIKRLELGAGWLQAYAWGSSSNKSIYQYELVDRGACADPHDDRDPACAAPTVFVRPDGSLLEPTSRHSFQSLPDVFAERLVGANVSYFADRRNSLGAVIYGAKLANLIDGIDLDTQEWSRWPTGRTYGAAGAHFSFGKSWLDVFGEASMSYDKTPDSPGPQSGGGGPAGILRITATKKRQELEAVFRAYSTDYANPYARPISQADEFEGQRARDELGGRLRYTATEKRWTLRALVDVWAPMSSLREDSVLGRAQPKLESYVRADVRTTDELRLGLWVRYQDKDLRAGGHEQCYEVSTAENENGEPIPCGGRQLTTALRGRYQPDRKVQLTGMVQHRLVDDGQSTTSMFKDKFRQDLSVWGIALWRPDPGIRARARVRYLHEAINDSVDTYLERSVSGLLDTTFALRGRDLLRARVDLKFWLDGRTSSLDRTPNPEVQLWLSYEARL